MSDPVRRQVRVRCSVDHAFETFTSRIDSWWPKSHRRFKGSRMNIEAKVGGRFYESTGSGQEAALGEVLRWDPPRAIAYTWHPGALDKPTKVEVTFADDGTHTVVEVVHAEGESALGDVWPERVRLFEKGWSTVLPAFLTASEETSK